MVVAHQRPLVGIGKHHTLQELQIGEAEGDNVVETEVDHPAVQRVAQAVRTKAPLACKEAEERTQQGRAARRVFPQSHMVVPPRREPFIHQKHSTPGDGVAKLKTQAGAT